MPWRIYGTTDPKDTGYKWDICPSFAECLANQRENMTARTTFARDAIAGELPAVSFIIPDSANSQHNGASMMRGDNWIAQNVSAVMNGPDWSSTAILITYDDCGCFYDHVNPNTPSTGFGLRVPMVIVSPYAKAGYTDSNTTSSTAGVLAFVEHNWSLPPIGTEANYYDYAASFDFTQTPLAPIPLPQHAVTTTATINPNDPT